MLNVSEGKNVGRKRFLESNVSCEKGYWGKRLLNLVQEYWWCKSVTGVKTFWCKGFLV